MNDTPSLNRFLFIIYLVVAAGIFVLSLVSPAVRAIASAPLRDRLVETDPITLTVLYSTEKEQWLTAAEAAFENNQEYRVNGRPIELEMERMGSREMVLTVLDGAQPVLISPASSLQISLLAAQAQSKFGAPLVNPADDANCRSLVRTPLVLAAWQERIEALWGGNPPARTWLQLHDDLTNPEGWSAYGHPEWGFIKFGHTTPLKSNSGLMTVLLMTYGYYDKVDGLTSADILDPNYQEWITEMESSISDFGDSTGTYMREIVAYGPSKYDIVAVYEATAIEQAENAVGRYGALQIYYPPTTVMSDHPFCILDTEWVTVEQAEAARLFIEYLQSEPVQQQALLEHGFRPTNTAVSLNQPGSPFTKYSDNGLSQTLPVEVEVPPGDVLDTLLDFWARNIQR